MDRMFSTPTAKFLQFDFLRNCFLVFAGPIIDPFAGSAHKFYKSRLRHVLEANLRESKREFSQNLNNN